MGGLVPEVRVDKLGRSITRHVRPGGPVAAAAASIPPAPAPVQQGRVLPSRIGAIVEALHSTNVDLRASARLNLIMSRTVDLAERLAASPNFDSEDGRRSLRMVLGMGRSEDTGRMLRGFSVIEGFIPATHLMRTVAGLKKVPFFASHWDHLDAAPPAVQNAARAATAVLARHLGGRDLAGEVKLVSVPGSTTKGYILPQEAVAVAEVVIARPDRFGDILPLVKEGATALQIEAILDGAPRALSEGAL